MPTSAYEVGDIQSTASWVQWTDYASRYPMREYRENWSKLPGNPGEYKAHADRVAGPIILFGGLNPHNYLARVLAEMGLIAPGAWQNAITTTGTLPANINLNPMALLVSGLKVTDETICYYPDESGTS